jgi:hypothetical protein
LRKLEGAKRTRGKADNPDSRARSRSAKKAQETKGHCYANQVVMWIHTN